MKKSELSKIIDEENGLGYSRNLNLNGYTFIKNESFVLFELKTVDEVMICHIKYIHVAEDHDFVNVMVNCCNFWIGNKVRLIFYKEKEKPNSPIAMMRDLGFRLEIQDRSEWAFPFDCNIHKPSPCTCKVNTLYK